MYLSRANWIKVCGWMLVVVLAACASKTDQPTVTRSADGASTAPAGKEAAKRDQALIRFINADSVTSSVDLWFGDSKIITGAGYRASGSYMEVPAEIRRFKVRAAGSDTSEPLAENGENVMSGRRYTLVFWRDENAKPRLQAISDDLKPTEAGKARLRVIHAAPGFKEVDIYETGSQELFGGVDVAEATAFKDVAPFKGMVQVRRAGRKSPSLLNASVNIEAGKSYTIILVPLSKSESTPIVLIDQLT
jgi:hypothetical protein